MIALVKVQHLQAIWRANLFQHPMDNPRTRHRVVIENDRLAHHTILSMHRAECRKHTAESFVSTTGSRLVLETHLAYRLGACPGVVTRRARRGIIQGRGQCPRAATHPVLVFFNSLLEYEKRRNCRAERKEAVCDRQAKDSHVRADGELIDAQRFTRPSCSRSTESCSTRRGCRRRGGRGVPPDAKPRSVTRPVSSPAALFFGQVFWQC